MAVSDMLRWALNASTLVLIRVDISGASPCQIVIGEGHPYRSRSRPPIHWLGTGQENLLAATGAVCEVLHHHDRQSPAKLEAPLDPIFRVPAGPHQTWPRAAMPQRRETLRTDKHGIGGPLA